MKFEYLREFIVAARSQELQQAAAELGISLSSLSKHLKSLELEIGAPLFVRARRTVLSHYGRILLPYAQELVALQDEYRADFSGGVNSSGELTVALSPIQFRERSGQVIEEFMLDIMYEIPSKEDVKSYTVTKEMVEKKISKAADLIKLPVKKEVMEEIA